MSGDSQRAPRGILAAAGIIAVITLAARIIGFGRWFAFSHSVGATCVGTVYQSVNAVPNVFYEIAAGGVLAAVVVPLVAAALGRGDTDAADRTASALLTWTVAALVPLAVIVVVAAQPLATVLLGTGCADQVALGTQMLQIFAVQIPLYGVGIVLGGVLQARRRFVAAALAPLLSSVVVIITYLVYAGMVSNPAAPIAQIPDSATTLLAVGTTLGVVALSLPLLIPLYRTGVRLRPRFTFSPGTGARVRRLALAGLLAVVGQQVAILVVIRLANDHGGPGAINIYTYTQAVTLLPYAVLAVPLATAAFPSLAMRAESDEGAGSAEALPGPHAVRTLNRTWQATIASALVGVGLLIALARPVDAFFARLDAGSSAQQVSLGMDRALLLYAPAVLGLSVIALLSRASYVRGRAVLVGMVVAAGWLGTALIPWIVLTVGDLRGADAVSALSLGASVGTGLAAAILVLLVHRSWGPGSLRLPVRSTVAVLLGSVAAAAVGWALSGVLPLARSGLVELIIWGLVIAAAALLTAAGVAQVIDPQVRKVFVRKVARNEERIENEESP